MSEPSRGLTISHRDKSVIVRQWSNAEVKDNPIIHEADLVKSTEHYLVMKLENKYEVWEIYTRGKSATRNITEVDGRFLFDFDVE